MNKSTSCFKSTFVIILILFIFYSRVFSQTWDPEPSLNIALNQLSYAQAYTNKSSYPRSTNTDGTIRRVGTSDWTCGFFPGSLWFIYEDTKNSNCQSWAEQWSAAIQSQQTNTTTHDLGFMLYSSFGQGFRLTNNATYKSILLQGAKSLSTRFNPVVGCIKSWDNKPQYTYPVIIDNMMNLEILFWATKVSGDSSYYKIAVRHALTTMANQFRPDNSSYQVVDYNPTDGSIISKTNPQGLNTSSDWARGQAWGLYGYTVCYRETGDTRFLNIAKKIADFYIAHATIPPNYVPFWDFFATDYHDASAACVASSALLELCEYVPENRTTYYNYAINILKSLSSSTYIAFVGSNNDFILKHSVNNKPTNTEVDKPANYADYYYIEAVLRYKKPAPKITATGGNGQVTLNWNRSTGATFYKIKRSSFRGGFYTTINSYVTNTTYVDRNLQARHTYYYIVTPSNSIGDGESSAEVGAQTNKKLNAPEIITYSGRKINVSKIDNL